MAQFDVYKNINDETKEQIPYLLDIQSDILSHLTSRVVIPFIINKKTMDSLHPIFLIEDIKVTLWTTSITSIQLFQLEEKVCSLKNKRREIIDSIDFLITGY